MTPKFLSFARRLALLTPTLVGCGSSTPAATTTVAPTPTPTTTSSPTTEPVAEGPCRCSWETDAAAAPRVCKKGEISHAGQSCVAKPHPKYPDMVEGPLPPPDLPSSV